jgi:hypothetical protein
VKGLAPLACKTHRIDAWVLAELSCRELMPAIWLPDPHVRASGRAGGCTWCVSVRQAGRVGAVAIDQVEPADGSEQVLVAARPQAAAAAAGSNRDGRKPGPDRNRVGSGGGASTAGQLESCLPGLLQAVACCVPAADASASVPPGSQTSIVTPVLEVSVRLSASVVLSLSSWKKRLPVPSTTG